MKPISAIMNGFVAAKPIDVVDGVVSPFLIDHERFAP
jgi:hypothetical protein